MRAHVFDMDGTLIPGTTAPLRLAAALGASEALHELEEEFEGHRITTQEFAARLHDLWGVVDSATVRSAFDDTPKLDGIAEVVDAIHAAGGVACVLTLSPDYFAEHFLPFGFDAVFASRFPRTVEAALDPNGILTAERKVTIAAEFCASVGTVLSSAVAYGDSYSDRFLFEEAGLAVSVNGDRRIMEVADLHVETVDLRDVYAQVDAALARSAPRGKRAPDRVRAARA